jgi:hypothetical protein
MRRVLLIFGLIIMACLPATLATASETDRGAVPVAVVPNPNYSFPTVVEGKKIQHDFIIRNTGSAPLVVHKVKTG